MTASDSFRAALLPYLDIMQQRLTTAEGEWAVKGFIDIDRNIYPMSLDTKVLSKVIEVMLWPVIEQFSIIHRYQVIPAAAQNHYPDITLISSDGVAFALDIKTTYRTSTERVNGMTLGTFMGYFRNRNRPTNSTLAYADYVRHFVLGIVYSRIEVETDQAIYGIADLAQIPSIARDFVIFLHEKHQIASDQPGSGNTTNIGSTRSLDRLMDGTGIFSSLGNAVFDDYWMHYQTRAMAREAGFDVPHYRDLRSYYQFKQHGAGILNTHLNDLPPSDED